MAQRRPTLADVAAQAGVSKAAVSRVINDAPGVSARTREHVRQVITHLGYRPDPVARALASGHGEVVELVIVDETSVFGTSPYYGRVTAGILQELAGSNAQLRVHVVDEPNTAALLDRIAASVSVGVLLINVPPALAGAFYRRCDRVVTMGPTVPGLPFVGCENAEGAYAAVRHLHETGRRRIAALHGPDGNSCAEGRREGYRRAVKDFDLPDIAVTGRFGRESGYELTRRLLAENPDFDAIFAGCDLLATGAMQALSDAGRRIPQDVAIVGFDDSVIAACANPPMSSVHQPVEQMAAAATRALVNRQIAQHWRCVFPAQLQIRQSTAP
ncbi:LacI family DNA-binding transcriptional regulator [Paractinoplanes brasiliensis]|uniref:LacI family transcriptional regulator n=1 Tax=Paractinoplanes brasiliensis TaxID=52695 RepID=A0A4R6JAL6_9ACTN|nr:LacI family DNA-binding transcriptional regulator [Actinoplanes brasiliensis]TDO32532.1 LacI family transcriptional regulator [Actinoplanes brasiliensis]GID27592.1 LacI family transcriptional regulator [Actinoplanes brasiliensis]